MTSLIVGSNSVFHLPCWGLVLCMTSLIVGSNSWSHLDYELLPLCMTSLIVGSNSISADRFSFRHAVYDLVNSGVEQPKFSTEGKYYCCV